MWSLFEKTQVFLSVNISILVTSNPSTFVQVKTLDIFIKIYVIITKKCSHN